MQNHIDTIKTRLETLPLTSADRRLATARIAQGEALADFLIAAMALVARPASPQPDPAHWRA
jgi:hypothetical protein